MTSLRTAMKPDWTLRFQLVSTPKSQFPTINATRLGSTTSPNSPTFRLGVSKRLPRNANLVTVLPVSNFRFTVANSPNGRSETDNTGDEARGPPILTIVAGLLVFAVLFWIASSIITLFFSLISTLLFGK